MSVVEQCHSDQPRFLKDAPQLTHPEVVAFQPPESAQLLNCTVHSMLQNEVDSEVVQTLPLLRGIIRDILDLNGGTFQRTPA